MPKPLPRLKLTHGQVMWALSLGRPPSQATVDALRYLRRLGVPFEKSELGSGRGHRLNYGYDQLIETGVALHGLRRRMRPREVAKFLVHDRRSLRRLYRQVYLEQPDSAIEQEWVKSRGRIGVLPGKEYFLRLHDRYMDRPEEVKLLTFDDIGEPEDLFSLAEGYPGEEVRTLLPISRLVLVWVAWALEAPEIRTGPQ